MSYALSTLWYERQRFFSAILAVAFSAVLICIQVGLLLGTFALTSIPIDYARADVWLSGPDTVSVDIGKPVPKSYLTRLAVQPEITAAEIYVVGFHYWFKPDGGSELVIVVGSNLGPDSLGAVDQLTPALRSRLTEPGAIAVDSSELDKLGIAGVGDVAQINARRVRVVGLVEGLAGLQGPYVFCSLQTAKHLLELSPDQTIYVLGKCKTPDDANRVVERLESDPQITVLSSTAFSWRSRLHWLTKTGSGVAMGIAAVLGLVVGAVVTRQSLYAATVASVREYAVLRALGIPRWRVGMNVFLLSFWVGLIGVAMALPILLGLSHVASYVNVPLMMPWWLVVSAVSLTWVIAVLAGLTSLHSLQRIEPMILLR